MNLDGIYIRWWLLFLKYWFGVKKKGKVDLRYSYVDLIFIGWFYIIFKYSLLKIGVFKMLMVFFIYDYIRYKNRFFWLGY